MEQEKIDALIRHNGALVRRANDMRLLLARTMDQITVVLDAAEPVAAQHEDEPSEFVVPAEDMQELRDTLVAVRAWCRAE